MEPSKVAENEFNRPLVQQGAYYVMISHKELDNLIAPLMHLAELDSDKEHREAMKQELKHIARNWLNEQYEFSGFSNYSPEPGAWIVNVDAIKSGEGRFYHKVDPRIGGSSPSMIGLNES